VIAMLSKEWRRLLRNPWMPWALLTYLLLPILVAWAYLAGLGGGQGIAPQVIAQLGGQTLNLVTTWQMLMLAVAAPFVAASLVAGEVEEGTLEPLLAAGPPLTLLIFAKLLAVIAFLLVVVVAGLPLFTLPLLVGGVTWTLIGRALLMEVTTAVAMASLGMLLSAFGRRSGTVALVGIALGLMLTLGGGMVTPSAPPSTTYEQALIMQMKMGMAQPQMIKISVLENLPKWLYLNPLVGLNAAINQTAGQGMFGLPGANLGPVYKGYRLWQVQAAGAWALALLAGLAATLAVRLRVGWRPPVFLRRRSIKEAMRDG
jgi:ABC-type transport system involved in multi-copper enzyme maturation permease subunit